MRIGLTACRILPAVVLAAWGVGCQQDEAAPPLLRPTVDAVERGVERSATVEVSHRPERAGDSYDTTTGVATPDALAGRTNAAAIGAALSESNRTTALADEQARSTSLADELARESAALSESDRTAALLRQLAADTGQTAEAGQRGAAGGQAHRPGDLAERLATALARPGGEPIRGQSQVRSQAAAAGVVTQQGAAAETASAEVRGGPIVAAREQSSVRAGSGASEATAAAGTQVAGLHRPGTTTPADSTQPGVTAQATGPGPGQVAVRAHGGASAETHREAPIPPSAIIDAQEQSQTPGSTARGTGQTPGTAARGTGETPGTSARGAEATTPGRTETAVIDRPRGQVEAHAARPGVQASVEMLPLKLRPPLEDDAHAHLQQIRRELMLGNVYLAALGMNRLQAFNLLDAMRAWMAEHGGTANRARADVARARRELQEAFRRQEAGLGDSDSREEITRRTLALQQVRQRYADLVSTIIPRIDARLSAEQKQVWLTVYNARGRGAWGDYLFAPNLSAEQIQTLSALEDERAGWGDLPEAERQQRDRQMADRIAGVLTGPQRSAINQARVNVTRLLGEIRQAEAHALPLSQQD